MHQTCLMFAVATAALLTACTSENDTPPPDNGVTALYVNVLDCGTLLAQLQAYPDPEHEGTRIYSDGSTQCL